METQKGADDTEGRKTLVEEGTEFRGSLASNCPVIVKGKVEGDISAPSLDVSATGSIRGRMKIGALVCAGELSGELDAESVQLSGVIKDQTVVRARSLDVRLGPGEGKLQTVFGECLLEIGDLPNKEAAITASMNAVNRETPSAEATEATQREPTASGPAPTDGTPREPAESKPSENGQADKAKSETNQPVGAEAAVLEHAGPTTASTTSPSGNANPASGASAPGAGLSDPAAAIIRALSEPADSEPNPAPVRHEPPPQGQQTRRSGPPKRAS